MMRSVQFIADDFGISHEVNEAVGRAYEAGALDGAALMVDQVATGEAVAMARAMPGLALGIHLNFSDRRDVAGGRWGAFPWGYGMWAGQLAVRRRRNAGCVEEETRRQLWEYRELGLELSFVNAHHHLHVAGAVYREIVRVLPELYPGFGGWMRLGAGEFLGMPATTLMGRVMRLVPGLGDPRWAGRASDRIVLGGLKGGKFLGTAEGVRRAVERHREGMLEVVFHPGGNKLGEIGGEVGDEGQDRSGELEALVELGRWRGG
jgi:hypothetical protein